MKERESHNDLVVRMEDDKKVRVIRTLCRLASAQLPASVFMMVPCMTVCMHC
jgi:hypothetical protein